MNGREKIQWRGRVISVQPRIRLLRSFDERSHSYLGYILTIGGMIGDEHRYFTVAVGKGAHAKHAFRIGDMLSGESVPVADPRLEVAEFYKTSRIKIIERTLPDDAHLSTQLPVIGVPPPLEVYRERGHRRLSAIIYKKTCITCLWGCKMPVEMTIDQWNPRQKRYRFETFCYGPKICRLYKPGRKRVVPGRKGMSWTEDDWVDEESTSHRQLDE